MSNTKDHIHFYEGIREETFYSKEEILKKLTDDYLRGLIEGEGHFGVDTKRNRERVPAFVLKMHVRDKELIVAIRDYLKIDNTVYEYIHSNRHYAMLSIRDIYSLKKKIVPMCKNKLLGFKGTQFDWWLKYFPYLNN